MKVLKILSGQVNNIGPRPKVAADLQPLTSWTLQGIVENMSHLMMMKIIMISALNIMMKIDIDNYDNENW